MNKKQKPVRLFLKKIANRAAKCSSPDTYLAGYLASFIESMADQHPEVNDYLTKRIELIEQQLLKNA